MEASAHVNSPAARARILRALPGQLTPAKLADPAASLAAVRALDAFCLTAADAIDAHDAASRADRDAIEDGSEALDRFVAHVERACDPRGGGDLASRAAAATLLGRSRALRAQAVRHVPRATGRTAAGRSSPTRPPTPPSRRSRRRGPCARSYAARAP